MQNLFFMTTELEGIQNLNKIFSVRQKVATMGQKTGIPPTEF